MREFYVVCKWRRRPVPGATVGPLKHVWWELEQARSDAQTKLWNHPQARVFICAIDSAATGIAAGPGGCDADERWRTIERTPVRYVETVRHSEERLVELVERRIVGESAVDQMDAFLRSTGAMK